MKKSWLVGTIVTGAALVVGTALFQLETETSTTEWVKVPRSNLSGRANWFWQQRAYPIGAIPVGARLDALEESEGIRPFSYAPAGMPGVDAVWTQLGPAGFDSMVEPTWGRQSGRSRALVVDPNDSSRLYLGTATGGVWRSTDSGTTWSPITDDQDTLSIGSLALDPQDSNTIYAGTGEGPQGAYYSVGILKSTDGGDTWTRLATDTFSRHSIGEIIVSPTDSNVLLACASNGSHQPGDAIPRDVAKSGIFRSTDGGASFTQVQVGNCQDLIASPANFANQFSSLTEVNGVEDPSENDGIYHSTDGGLTWTQVSTAGAPAGSQRLNIGISADGNTLYAGGKDEFEETTIWKSTDGGANWSTIAGAPDYCEGQCGYDNDVAVSPANADHAYFAGIPFFRTLDGGTTFDQIGASNESQPRGSLHVDNHILTFDPNDSNTLYLGNDGGIYRSSNIGTAGDIANPGPTWTSLTGTSIGSIQFYDLAIHPTDPNVMLGGVQDNGTQVRTSDTTVWTEQCGGDGSSALIDHSDPMTMYCSFAYTGGGSVGILKSTDGGATFPTDASLDIGEEGRSGFITPLAMDPTDSMTIYAGGSRLFRTVDGGMNWAPIGPEDLTMGDPATISALEIAPSDPMTIWVTTSDGLVQRSADGGATFTNTTKAPLPGRFATSVAIHPTDPNTAFAGFTGFDDGTPGAPGHIFRTNDGGATWVNVTGNLPDTPVNHIALNPTTPSTVYAGTDVGVYVANAGGAAGPASAGPQGNLIEWQKFTGLPNAGVIRIRANATTNQLVVATYGRSVWATQLAPSNFLYFPFVQGDAENFTGLAFTNDGDTAADLEPEAIKADGTLQIYPQNPASLQLPSKQQVARLAAEFFGVDTSTPRDGWIRVRSSSSQIASFFQFGNGLGGSMTKLDGSTAFGSQSKVFYFTRLYDGTGSFPAAGGALDAQTLLSIANPNGSAISLTLKLFNAAGQQVGDDVTRNLPALGCLLESISSLFGQAVVSEGFVRVDVTDGAGAVGFELIQLADTLLGFSASFGNEQTNLYSAQLAHGTAGKVGITTSGKLVNVSGEARAVTVTATGATGQMLGQVNINLDPNASFQGDLGDAFGLGPLTDPAVTGSIQAVADGPGVIGDVVFGEAQQLRFGAALPMQTQLLKRAVFSQVANRMTGNPATSSFTGYAFQNPQTETANFKVSVFSGEGAFTGSGEFILPPGARTSEVLDIAITGTAGQEGGYILVESDQPLVGQQMFGNLTLDYLSAVPPTVFD